MCPWGCWTSPEGERVSPGLGGKPREEQAFAPKVLSGLGHFGVLKLQGQSRPAPKLTLSVKDRKDLCLVLGGVGGGCFCHLGRQNYSSAGDTLGQFCQCGFSLRPAFSEGGDEYHAQLSALSLRTVCVEAEPWGLCGVGFPCGRSPCLRTGPLLLRPQALTLGRRAVTRLPGLRGLEFTASRARCLSPDSLPTLCSAQWHRCGLSHGNAPPRGPGRPPCPPGAGLQGALC